MHNQFTGILRKIEDYEKIVGESVIQQLKSKAEQLSGYRVVHVNSTYLGGGVAEILESHIPLLNSLGIKAEWYIIKGSPEFYTITKKLHHALQGAEINLTSIKERIYLETCQLNALIRHFDHDLVMIHDPQPLALIAYSSKSQPWIWRCHIQLSNPNQVVWSWLRNFLERYDGMIVHFQDYLRSDISIPQYWFPPGIDPLSSKNMELSDRTISKYLYRYGIEREDPIILQVARFDRWKRPLEALKVFLRLRRRHRCQLVLIGSLAWDDPEAMNIYRQIHEKARKYRDIWLITEHNNILVNALQRSAAVALQLSSREGFGLSVAEAQWKGVPVVGYDVGGISHQIIHARTGFLVRDESQCLDALDKLLEDPKLRSKMGREAKQHVLRNFLITRAIKDELELYSRYLRMIPA